MEIFDLDWSHAESVPKSMHDLFSEEWKNNAEKNYLRPPQLGGEGGGQDGGSSDFQHKKKTFLINFCNFCVPICCTIVKYEIHPYKAVVVVC